MQDGFDRRHIIRLTAGASAAALLGGPASAQKRDILQILGLKGDGLGGVKPLNVVRIIASIAEMESKAEALGLPSSPLAFNSKPTTAIPTDGSLYQVAVPRLVSVIDRAEGSDPALADQAGELLAEVHAAEHETPDALKPEPIKLSTASSYAALKDEYRRLFETAGFVEQHAATIDWQMKMALQAKARYESVGNLVQVPWHFIAAIHGLEASFNFRAHFHNGDFPLKARTRQVPAGRPLVWLPPDDWESSAKDALRLLGFAGQTDWSLERTLYRLEAYNGFGYRKRGVPSPYLWAFTGHYVSGKFVADGRWNASAKSRQCGAATLLKALTDAGHIKFV